MSTQTDYACYIVRAQYPNGHKYWHAFAEKKGAVEFSTTYNTLDVVSQIYFGACCLSAKQAQDSRGPRGCDIAPEQLSNIMREVSV